MIQSPEGATVQEIAASLDMTKEGAYHIVTCIGDIFPLHIETLDDKQKLYSIDGETPPESLPAVTQKQIKLAREAALKAAFHAVCDAFDKVQERYPSNIFDIKTSQFVRLIISQIAEELNMTRTDD